ncbi:hypothetical protein YC2023_038788 [Brassica napus]
MSFIDDKNAFVSSTCLRSVPKINMSLIYKQMITPLPNSSNLLHKHLSDWFNMKPFDKTTSSNLWCHCLGACFSPYNDLINLHTLCSLPGITKPSSCFIYTSSSKIPFKNAVLTSIW